MHDVDVNFVRSKDAQKQLARTSVPKWRDAHIARAHGNILNLSYAYVIARTNLSCVDVLSAEFETE